MFRGRQQDAARFAASRAGVEAPNVRKGDHKRVVFVRFDLGSIRVFACVSTAMNKANVSSSDGASRRFLVGETYERRWLSVCFKGKRAGGRRRAGVGNPAWK